MDNSQPKSKILIVDDDEFARESIEALLLKQGYQLYFAENGENALEMVSTVIPDLILLDIMLPDMDGFEICKKIRNDDYVKEIPVIFISALDDRDSRIDGIKAGADDFISKPYDKTELRLRVKTILRLDRYRQIGKESKKELSNCSKKFDMLNSIQDKLQIIKTHSLQPETIMILTEIEECISQLKKNG